MSFDDELRRGASLYQSGEFFEAHETWEGLWRTARDAPTRTLLQGLIQAAAAFHKLYAMGDPASAARILTRAHAKVASAAASGAPHGHFAIANLEELAYALAQAADDLRGDRPWPRAPELRMTPHPA